MGVEPKMGGFPPKWMVYNGKPYPYSCGRLIKVGDDTRPFFTMANYWQMEFPPVAKRIYFLEVVDILVVEMFLVGG